MEWNVLFSQPPQWRVQGLLQHIQRVGLLLLGLQGNHQNNNYNNNNNYNQNNNINNQNNNAKAINFRGEIFYTYLQQIVARYNIERLSNGLPQVQQIEYDQPIQSGFNPQLQYENGQAVPNRPANVQINNNQANNNNNENNNFANAFVNFVKTHEQRIFDAIDANAVKNNAGVSVPINPFYATNTISNIVEANADGANNQYYGSYFTELLKLVGSASDANKQLGLAPSALENYQTQIRDPAFFNIAKRVVNVVNHYKNVHFKPYTTQELRFNGVQVQSFDVSPLVTYNEYAKINVNNAVNNNRNNNNNNKIVIHVGNQ
uniref:Allergen Cr-PI n=1 Tax=Cacopsylla melanoneura TaxID=428564 RepID=A0A8D8WBZ5_9HEMI